MSIKIEPHCSRAEDESSEDECLSEVKKKAEPLDDNFNSDDEPLMTEVLVSVEFGEYDEQPLNFSTKRDRKNSPSPVLKPIPLLKNDGKINRRKMKQLKPKKIKSFTCTVCNEVFAMAGDLKKHSLEHQVQTRHKCEICNRYFKKAFSLRLHKRVHMEKLVKCPLCDLTFNLKINLGRHMMSHERTEACDRCPAKFHTKDQRDAHIRHHNHLESLEIERLNEMAVRSSETQSEHDTDIKNENDASDDSTDCQNPSPTNPMPFFFSEYESITKKEDLNHATLCAIVSKMHKGRSVPDVCRLYNLTAEVVNEIWEERDKYIIPKRAGKRTAKYMNGVLDSRIVAWFENQKANNIQVSGKMLQDVAESFAKECGFVAFNGSKKWLDRFKKRYNICLRGTPTKRDYNNPDSKWKTLFFKEQWSDARLGIADEDIYSADEIGVYYNPSKGRIKKLGGKKFIQGWQKDRLSIFMCANVTGTDKKKLLVCGSEDPLIHSHRDPDTLPVTYIRHAQAHFTTEMFEEYVKYWNRELQLNNRRSILILDRATIHTKLQLSHLKLVFVPWKATNGLIPVKNGVFQRFRSEYRKLFLEEKAMNVLRGVDRNMTCLEALHMVQKAWERTPMEIITQSFITIGYDVLPPKEYDPVDIPKVNENDEEMLCNILKEYDVESYFTNLPDLDQYLTVDEELLTGQGTNCSVFGGNHRPVDQVSTYCDKEKEDILPISTEKPESDEREASIKKTRALQDLEIVKKYLQSNSTGYDTYCAFMELENFVLNNPTRFNT